MGVPTPQCLKTQPSKRPKRGVLRVLRRLGSPCERGGVVNTSDSDDTDNATASVIAQREQPDARRDCLPLALVAHCH